MMKSKKFSLMVCLVIGLLLQPVYAFAQSETALREDQKSVVVLDLRVDRLLKEFVAAGFQNEGIGRMKLAGPLAEISLSQVERVSGAACLPKDLVTLSQIVADPRLKDFPVVSSVVLQALTNGCFLKIKFVDKAVADQVEARWKVKPPVMKMGEFKYDIPWGQKKDDAFFAHRVDETTIEFGSKAYLRQTDREFFTDRLNAAYQAAPQEPFRLVVDFETRRELLKEAIKLAKKDVPRPTHAYLDLLESLKTAALTYSFDSENLLSLIAEADTDSDAEELAGGIDSLLQFGKLGFGTVYGQITRQAPQGAREPLAMIKGMVDGLGADQSEAIVKVLVKKPENFVAMLSQLSNASVEQLKETTRMNEIRQATVAVGDYSKAQKHLPFKVDPQRAHPTISWRVKLLPYIRNTRIAGKVNLAKAATEAPNAQFANSMPKAFGADGSLATVLWVESDVDSIAEVKDGAANTIMLIESPQGRPWIESKPLTAPEAIAMVRGLADGEALFVGLYDGSVSKVTNQLSEGTLRNLFDPNDGNVVDASWKK